MNAILGRLLFVAVALSLVFPSSSWSEERLKVVTTLSTFASLVEEIGGDLVEVHSIASPRYNPHFIEPRPSDLLRLKRCDLFVHGGLDLETWRSALVDAAARPEVGPGGARELNLSRGITLLGVPAEDVTRADGDLHLHGNPHYWLSPANGLVLIRSIGERLASLLPPHAPAITDRMEDLRNRLTERMAEWRLAARSYAGRELVGFHDEWIYLMNFLSFRMERFVEPKPGISPGPRSQAALEEYLKSRKVVRLIRASFNPEAPIAALSERTGIEQATLCQNVGELPPCSNYMKMLDFNISLLLSSDD